MQYNWKGDAMAKFWIFLLLLALVVNSGILIGFQVMTNYPYASRDEILEAYADYNILDQQVTPELSAWLLAAPGKENRLVLTEKHFAVNRLRIVLDEDVGRNYTASRRGDIGKISVHVKGDSQIDTLTFRPSSLPLRIGTFWLRIPLGFLLWNLAILTIEILLGYLLHKARNG